jgi:formylglycine-generating enzyme required for sulfatase activity
MGNSEEQVATVMAICLQVHPECRDTWFADEQPPHEEKVAAFSIDKYEVTNAQFAEFIASNGYGTRDYWTEEGWNWRTQNNITAPLWWETGKNNSGPQYPDYPVVGVSWYEADAYCRWAGKRLPTEMEWEWAARMPDSRLWPWGNHWEQDKCNWRWGYRHTVPVNQFPQCASFYGVVGLADNVSEWTSDPYRCYPNSEGCEGEADRRVVRGGSWNSNCCDTHAAYRARFKPETRNAEIGFRCAK